MGVQVQLDYNEWLGAYPQFRNVVSEAQATALFAEADLYHANDGSGRIINPVSQKALLGLVVAHLVATTYGENGDGGTGLVGQITSASKGGASLSVQPLQATGTQAWWLTTPYGARYWRAMAAYRTMHYRVPLPRIFDPFIGRLRAFPLDEGW